MKPEEAAIEKVKKQLEAQYARSFTNEETREAMLRRERICKILANVVIKLDILNSRLKDEPKGFHLPESYPCCICGTLAIGDNSWYDQYGAKCMLCQKAVDNNVVPTAICHDKAIWYSMEEVIHYYDVRTMSVRKLIQLGKLKSRIIPDKFGKPYFHVFLIAENSPVLGPKPEFVGIRTSPTCITYNRSQPRELVVPGITVPNASSGNRQKAVPPPENWTCSAIINKNLYKTSFQGPKGFIWDWSDSSESDKRKDWQKKALV